MTQRVLRSACLSAIALAFAFAPGAARATGEIGSVAAVNRDIDSTPPGQGTRALLLGDRLIQDERLVSSDLGSGQMLFLDQTSLTVAPNSSIVLDKYVYDPDSEAGEIGVSVARGVLRVIGGRITKNTEAVIRTPTATIGIRGGIALISVDAQNRTRVMHVAGEYTRVEAGGRTLTMSRANAYANVDPGSTPEFLGTASEEDVASLYDQTQGGGGGTETPPGDQDAADSGLSGVNSEQPDAVVDPPISTSGESTANDNSQEVEQTTVASDNEVQQENQLNPDRNPDATPPGDTGGPTPPPPPPGNRFADFVGGFIFADNEPLVDDQGQLIQEPSAQNFLTTDDGLLGTFSEGSLIASLEDGSVLTLPVPDANGVFPVNPAATQGPDGQVFGAGYADLDSGLLTYYLQNQEGLIGALFAAREGPTQLRTINAGEDAFRATAFNILPDLHVSIGPTEQPFLPTGLGALFDTGEQPRLFLINRPNRNTFSAGSGFSTSTGAKWLIPQFSLKGVGASQAFLLQVGASNVLNNGTGSPDMSSFARGAFRVDGQMVPNRLQAFAGTLGIPADTDAIGGPTVFGQKDDYLLLGNSSAYHNDGNPEEESSASFFTNIASPDQAFYGNLHVAQRDDSISLARNDRIRFGATPAQYAAETSLTGAAQLAENQARFMSFGYASNAAVFRDSSGFTEKLLMRTAAVSSAVTAGFGLRDAEGSMVLELDDVATPLAMTPSILGARLAFGGERSAVINDARFGMRDHPNPAALVNVLTDTDLPPQFVATLGGLDTGRAPDQFGQSAWRGALLSHGLADARSIFPANTPQTPKYLTWGWWTGQFRFGQTSSSGTQYDNARIQYALGTWVAGNRTDVLPMTGNATFNGPVVVNAIDANGADFVDGGRFQLDWNFASGTGSAQFQNVLDLPNFSVPVAANAASGVSDYGGSQIFGPNMTQAAVDGSFFDGLAPNDARATAGSIRIDDFANSRVATGTFWGER